MSDTPPSRPRLTLLERAARTDEKLRDCRVCPMYEPDRSGMAFGYCQAHEQYVKLYHPEGEFFSQCQFKVLSRPVRR